jgi:hypothetical protein
LAGRPKPNLTIDTKVASTGNKFLDEEKKRMEDSKFCEHE